MAPEQRQARGKGWWSTGQNGGSLLCPGIPPPYKPCCLPPPAQILHILLGPAEALLPSMKWSLNILFSDPTDGALMSLFSTVL